MPYNPEPMGIFANTRLLIQEIREDYQHFGRFIKDRAMWAMTVHRFGRWALRLRTKPARWICGKIYGVSQLGIQLIGNIVLDRTTQIGKQFRMGASGRISIHARAIIGNNVGISHDVTIGNNMIDETPVIGDNVFIGRGASVVGGVHIGDGAYISANSLVMTDIPAGATAIGVPAKAVANLSKLRKYKEKRKKSKKGAKAAEAKAQTPDTDSKANASEVATETAATAES